VQSLLSNSNFLFDILGESVEQEFVLRCHQGEQDVTNVQDEEVAILEVVVAHESAVEEEEAAAEAIQAEAADTGLNLMILMM